MKSLDRLEDRFDVLRFDSDSVVAHPDYAFRIACFRHDGDLRRPLAVVFEGVPDEVLKQLNYVSLARGYRRQRLRHHGSPRILDVRAEILEHRTEGLVHRSVPSLSWLEMTRLGIGDQIL